MAARLLADSWRKRCGRRCYALPQIRGMALASEKENAAAQESAGAPTSWFQKIKGLFIREKPEEKQAPEAAPKAAGTTATSTAPPAQQSVASKFVNTVKSVITPAYTMETFADELKKARLSGNAIKGVSADRVVAILERQERMLRAMAVYKTDQIGGPQVAEVASKCGVKIEEVEEILSKFLWTKEAYNKVEKLKQEGKPLPKSFEEVEALMGGRWKSPKPILSRNQLCSCGSGKKYRKCCGYTGPDF